MTGIDYVMWMIGWWFSISLVVALIIAIVGTSLKRGGK